MAMQRIGRSTRLKPGAEAEYRTWHRQVWPELLALNKQAGIRNYSIFIDGTRLFSYLEVDDFAAAAAFLERDETSRRWQALMAPFMDSDDEHSPWVLLEEVFHAD
jgi:L-rhamnose mutarotase